MIAWKCRTVLEKLLLCLRVGDKVEILDFHLSNKLLDRNRLNLYYAIKIIHTKTTLW